MSTNGDAMRDPGRAAKGRKKVIKEARKQPAAKKLSAKKQAKKLAASKKKAEKKPNNDK